MVGYLQGSLLALEVVTTVAKQQLPGVNLTIRSATARFDPHFALPHSPHPLGPELPASFWSFNNISRTYYYLYLGS